MQLSRTRSLCTATITTLGALALVGTTFTGTAAAGDKGHGATADRAAASYTEDTDTNDGGTPNNVADSGDDRHPSGKDRSVERGGSGTQGRSTSDPDDDGRGPDRSNGGPDKPNGSGGLDLADQDGNNGCGNDDDFEDDNEGWCGRRPAEEKAERQEAPAKAATTDDDSKDDDSTCPTGMTDADADTTGGCVAAGTEVTFAAPAVVTLDSAEVLATAAAASAGVVPAEGEVLAAAATAAPATPDAPASVGSAVSARSAGAGALAFTGSNVFVLVGAALLALAAGWALLRADRRRSRA